MNARTTLLTISCSLTMASLPLYASVSDDYQRCLLHKITTVPPGTTVEQLQELCAPQPSVIQQFTEVSPHNSRHTTDNDNLNDIDTTKSESELFDNRRRVEIATRNELFVISPHKPNYFLPISYSFENPTLPVGDKQLDLDKTEFQFQVSLKFPVITNLFSDVDSVYVAYTNQSWWQAYHKDISSPFREVNHEPEIFYNMSTDYDLFGMRVRSLQLGLSHQSNGRGGELSRSWNRIYASILLEKDNFYIGFKPWWRLKEDKKKYPGAADGDDNPDITEYLGYGELTMFYKFQNDHAINVMIRNNLRAENKGALQLGWSFPLTTRLRGYIQYFSGYGESLIDYDNYVNRLGIGIMLTDWL